MLAHEVNGWQTELLFALIAILLVVKVDCCLLHLGDFTLAVPDLGNFLIQLRIVLVDSLLLVLEVLQHKRLKDAKSQVFVLLQDFKDEKWRQDVLLSDIFQGCYEELIVSIIVRMSLIT